MNKVVEQSNKAKQPRKVEERDIDVKGSTLGWGFEDESNARTFKKAATLGGVSKASSAAKDLYSMYSNGQND